MHDLIILLNFLLTCPGESSPCRVCCGVGLWEVWIKSKGFSSLSFCHPRQRQPGVQGDLDIRLEFSVTPSQEGGRKMETVCLESFSQTLRETDNLSKVIGSDLIYK